jgi:hypothetical protein
MVFGVEGATTKPMDGTLRHALINITANIPLSLPIFSTFFIPYLIDYPFDFDDPKPYSAGT